MDQIVVDFVGPQQLRQQQKALRGSTGQQRGAISSVDQGVQCGTEVSSGSLSSILKDDLMDLRCGGS